MSKESVVDKFVNNLPFELHGWDPYEGKYSSLGPGTNHKERLEKYIETGDRSVIAKNDLDLAAFFHDNAYSKYKNASQRKESDMKLIDDAWAIANDESKDGYERGYAALTAKFFENKVKRGLGLALSRTKELKLKNTYYDPSKGFSSISELSRRTKIKPSEVKEWLLQQETYTRHKPVKERHQYRRVIVEGIDDQWQADLCDMRNLSEYNNKYKYILTVIDVFSKYAWAVAIKTKTGNEVSIAFAKIFKQRKPNRLQTDKGTEFINKTTQELLRKHSITWFATENEFKAQIVERFNRTLKGKMYKYFTANNTRQWVNILPDLVENYNSSYHRSIKMTPNEASKKSNERKARDNLDMYSYPVQKRPAFNLGDTVRISKYKGKFKKGYTPNYTSELFTISAILYTNPITYKITDKNNEVIKGTFYEQELSKFNS